MKLFEPNEAFAASSTCLENSLSRRSFFRVGAAAFCLAGMGNGTTQAARVRRNFYVSPAGSDSNTGTLRRPFLTIGGVFRRITDLGARDRINVMPGTYNEAVTVNAGGSSGGNLILVSTVRYGAKIVSPPGTYSAINIKKSYVTIDGFDVQSGGTGHGIDASSLDGSASSNGPHHISIVNNACHDSAGSGISVAYGDFYLIENNVCYRNCATNPFQGSGISVYAPRAVSGSQTTRIFVLRNTCFSNTALTLPNDAPHLDGNGIILDDFRNSQKPSAAGAYPYRSLVENNVCYFNGGKGVILYLSDNVVVRNNTCYFNNRDPKNISTWRGDLSNVSSNNTIWVNNIAYADLQVNSYNRALLDASTDTQPGNVVWNRNLTFNGTAGSASITQSPANAALTSASPYSNLLGVDPLFVAAGPNVLVPDLHLQPNSPARDTASAQYGIGTVDIDGKPRPYGTAADLGAYEFQG